MNEFMTIEDVQELYLKVCSLIAASSLYDYMNASNQNPSSAEYINSFETYYYAKHVLVNFFLDHAKASTKTLRSMIENYDDVVEILNDTSTN